MFLLQQHKARRTLWMVNVPSARTIFTSAVHGMWHFRFYLPFIWRLQWRQKCFVVARYKCHYNAQHTHSWYWLNRWRLLGCRRVLVVHVHTLTYTAMHSSSQNLLAIYAMHLYTNGLLNSIVSVCLFDSGQHHITHTQTWRLRFAEWPKQVLIMDSINSILIWHKLVIP